MATNSPRFEVDAPPGGRQVLLIAGNWTVWTVAEIEEKLRNTKIAADAVLDALVEQLQGERARVLRRPGADSLQQLGGCVSVGPAVKPRDTELLHVLQIQAIRAVGGQVEFGGIALVAVAVGVQHRINQRAQHRMPIGEKTLASVPPVSM